MNYLSMDRPDIQWSTRECSKGMASPSRGDLTKLKRLVRYLSKCPRAKTTYYWQKMPEKITVQTDSDWAGDRKTRKSVTGGNLRIGSCFLRSWSKEQSHIALSSGEAELYAANYGAAQAIGMQSMMKDFDIALKVEVQVDANAALGIVHRRGLGKLRHIDVQDLWMQKAVAEDKMSIKKIPGSANAADIGTKPLSAEAIGTFMTDLGFQRI